MFLNPFVSTFTGTQQCFTSLKVLFNGLFQFGIERERSYLLGGLLNGLFLTAFVRVTFFVVVFFFGMVFFPS